MTTINEAHELRSQVMALAATVGRLGAQIRARARAGPHGYDHRPGPLKRLYGRMRRPTLWWAGWFLMWLSRRIGPAPVPEDGMSPWGIWAADP